MVLSGKSFAKDTKSLLLIDFSNNDRIFLFCFKINRDKSITAKVENNDELTNLFVSIFCKNRCFSPQILTMGKTKESIKTIKKTDKYKYCIKF